MTARARKYVNYPPSLRGTPASTNSTVRIEQNGTGSISTAGLEEGLRQLGVLDGMSREQAGLATRRFDCNGDGTVSLPEFLAFAGRPYTANDRPLEAKLRRVLLKAESVRTCNSPTTPSASPVYVKNKRACRVRNMSSGVPTMLATGRSRDTLVLLHSRRCEFHSTIAGG